MLPNTNAMGSNSRNFIKQIGSIAAGAGLITVIPLIASANNNQPGYLITNEVKPFTISVLQTSDVHCQIHPLDKLFWVDNITVFRKTGGYAQLASYFKKERKKMHILL